jgi:hypothetical protein
MNDWARFVTTLIIWVTLAGIITSVGRTVDDSTAVIVVLTIGATISTGMVWGSGRMGGTTASEQASKIKRSSRVTRLVDHLDDEEVVQLEDLLASRRDSQYQERN